MEIGEFMFATLLTFFAQATPHARETVSTIGNYEGDGFNWAYIVFAVVLFAAVFGIIWAWRHKKNPADNIEVGGKVNRVE